MLDLARKIGVSAAQSIKLAIERGQRTFEALHLAPALTQPGDLRFERVLQPDLLGEFSKLVAGDRDLVQTLLVEPRLAARFLPFLFDCGDSRAKLVADFTALFKLGQAGRRGERGFVALPGP